MFEQIIVNQARNKRANIAYTDGASSITYQQMAVDIALFTQWLKGRGVKNHQRVALHIANVYLHWVSFFAIEALGAVSIALRTALPLSESRLSFIGAGFYLTDQALTDSIPLAGDVLDRGSLLRIRKFRNVPLPSRERTGDDPICIVLSSGTTGTPKKVVLSREIIDIRAIRERSSELIHERSRVLVLLPNESIGAVLTIITAWAIGATICIRPSNLSAERALTTMRPTMAAGAPSHFVELLDQLPEEFVSITGIDAATGGGTLPETVAAAIQRKLRGQITMTYGSTEMGYIARGDFALTREYPSAAGYLLPYTEVSIRNDAGAAILDGQIGEIWVRGPHVIAEYVDSPGDTAKSFRNGWYHPGDLGSVNHAGVLTIHGRSDDLMNYRGVKILPSAVEDRILGLRLVSDVAVFMAHTLDSNERLPWIVCVATLPFEPEELAFALPTGVPYVLVYLDVIPRNMMGKIERALLQSKAETGALKIDHIRMT